jgi:hypothetical protein
MTNPGKPWEAMYRALLGGLYKSIIDLESDKEIALNLSVVVKAHVENMAGFDGVPVEEWVDYRGWRDENETGFDG